MAMDTQNASQDIDMLNDAIQRADASLGGFTTCFRAEAACQVTPSDTEATTKRSTIAIASQRLFFSGALWARGGSVCTSRASSFGAGPDTPPAASPARPASDSSECAAPGTTQLSWVPPSAFVQRDDHVVQTADGWRLHVQHAYDPTSEATASCSTAPPPRQHPVLLVPGLASSGSHTFDLLPQHSLVEMLVSQGWDVWVADLRGNGRSQKPRLFDCQSWWTVDDHLQLDVPAVVDHVLLQTGAKQLHWIGHSMGGMLASGLLSRGGRHASALRSITLLASGCFGAGSWHSLLTPLILGVTRAGFPAGIVCAAISVAAAKSALMWPLEALFYWPGNTSRAAAAALMRGCFCYIPPGVITQFLGSLNGATGLTSVDGAAYYADPEVLSRTAVPALGINGSRDLFCPAAGGRRTVSMLGGECKHVTLGPSHGTRRHYGHFDVVCGHDAAEECFPHILDWLDRHDAPVSSASGTSAESAASA